jgi:hypothetical protein
MGDNPKPKEAIDRIEAAPSSTAQQVASSTEGTAEIKLLLTLFIHT